MSAKGLYLLVDGALGVTLFSFIDVRLAIAFVTGMVFGGIAVYMLIRFRGKRIVVEQPQNK